MCWSISIAYNNTKTQPWCVDEENPSHPCCVQFIQTVDCSSFCSRVYHFQQSWWGYTTTNFQFFVFMKKNCLAITCKKKKKKIYWNLHILMSCFDERDRFLTFFSLFCCYLSVLNTGSESLWYRLLKTRESFYGGGCFHKKYQKSAVLCLLWCW